MPITAPLLSYLQNSEKILPMAAIETCTSLGRTYQGYERGGKTEARERACEETIGAIVWLFGVKTLNSIGDLIGKHIFKLEDLDTDVGKDALRKPFENITKKKGATAVFKFSKIAMSVILGTVLMGAVVPKVKQAMTNALRMKDGLEPIPYANSKDGKYHPGAADKFIGLFIKPEKKAKEPEAPISNQFPSMESFLSESKNKAGQPSFKGASPLDAVLYASHNLENNTVWRLLSVDAGTLTGRVVNSRTPKEKIEYLIRDSISSFFYVFAAPLFSMGLRKMTSTPDVAPKGALATAEKLKQVASNPDKPLKTGFLTADILSNDAKAKLTEGIKFDKNKVISLEDFNAQTLGKYKDKAELMSMLQPKLFNEQGVKAGILSEKQVADIMSDSVLSDPKYLKKAIADATNGKSDDIKAFVSRKKLEKIRDSFDDFAVGLDKYAQKKAKDGVIDKALIDKYAKSLNLKNLGIHLAGMTFAVFGLAYLIPKFQYFVSSKITGNDEFAGTAGFDTKQKDN